MTLPPVWPRRAWPALLLLVLAAAHVPVAAQGPVVNAVLFYSPTCPHCHEVINTHLPPLREKYGDAFVVIGVDVTTPGGSSLYNAAVEYYGLAPDRLGVPLLVVGEVTLLGSGEIPARLPGLIEDGLAAGGTPWPALPALREALVAQGLLAEAPAVETTPSGASPDSAATPPATEAPAPTRDAASRPGDPDATPAMVAPDAPAPSGGATEDTPPAAPTGPATLDVALTPGSGAATQTVGQRFLRDPVGNSVAVVVFLALVGALVVSVLALKPGSPPLPAFPTWIVPVLALAGLGVAAYLSMVEVTGSAAVCGPVGDCNAVQQSDYARLFGVIPVGLLGASGYLGILVAWAVAGFGPQAVRRQARVGLWGLALVGTAFSAYLTFLEPFVIGATCVWCVASAMIMATVLLAATGARQRG